MVVVVLERCDDMYSKEQGVLFRQGEYEREVM
jgi:hypothetical protein